MHPRGSRRHRKPDETFGSYVPTATSGRSSRDAERDRELERDEMSRRSREREGRRRKNHVIVKSPMRWKSEYSEMPMKGPKPKPGRSGLTDSDDSSSEDETRALLESFGLDDVEGVVDWLGIGMDVEVGPSDSASPESVPPDSKSSVIPTSELKALRETITKLQSRTAELEADLRKSAELHSQESSVLTTSKNMLQSTLKKFQLENRQLKRSIGDMNDRGFTLDNLERLQRQKRLLEKERDDRDDRIEKMLKLQEDYLKEIARLKAVAGDSAGYVKRELAAAQAKAKTRIEEVRSHLTVAMKDLDKERSLGEQQLSEAVDDVREELGAQIRQAEADCELLRTRLAEAERNADLSREGNTAALESASVDTKRLLREQREKFEAMLEERQSETAAAQSRGASEVDDVRVSFESEMKKLRDQHVADLEAAAGRTAKAEKAGQDKLRKTAEKFRSVLKSKVVAVQTAFVKKLKGAKVTMDELRSQLSAATEDGAASLASAIAASERAKQEETQELREEYEAKLEASEEEVASLKEAIDAEKSKSEAMTASLRESSSALLEGERQKWKESTQATVEALESSHTEVVEGLEKEKEALNAKLEEAAVASSSIGEKVEKVTAELDVRTGELEEERKAHAGLKARASDAIQKFQAQLKKMKEIIRSREGMIGSRDKTIVTLRDQLSRSSAGIRVGVGKLQLRVRDLGFAGFKSEIRSQLEAMSKYVFSTFQTKGMNPVLEKLNSLEAQYGDEVRRRRRIFNELQDLRGKIRVFIRVRPVLEIDHSEGPCIECLDGAPLLRVKDVVQKKITKFEFDSVFSPRSTQPEIFKEVKDLSTSVLDGYNVCIFAYGQTGSGKTFTMEGPPGMTLKDESLKGINYRAVTELFRVVHQRSGEYDYVVQASIIEIYIGRVYDLLAGDRRVERTLRMAGESVEVHDVTKETVTDLGGIVRILKRAKKIRATASTKVNIHSSRSHCIVSLECVGRNRISGVRLIGKLHLIDLAGSERMKKTQLSDPTRVGEAVAINKSLTSLGMVMTSLAKKESHIPYRNSALTSYLKDSLGGQSKVLMLCCLNPSRESLDECLNSLKFSLRIKKIELGKIKRNIRTD